ncbi:MAG: hypothetical protein ACQ9MH_13010 [Nitrospinales bacterium]
MKKISLLALAIFVSMSAYVSAADVAPGQSASCTDAKSINVEVDTIPNSSNDKYGYTNNDRGTANLVVWKSSNFTTVPLSLGPNDFNTTTVGKDKGKTGLPSRGTPGRNVFVLTQQSNFSRGDSIGDISGLVNITNNGTNTVRIICN